MRERSRKREAAAPEPGKDPIAAELGRRGGIKGGRARAESLPPELRRAIAQRAAASRWARVRAERVGEQPHLPGTPTAEAVGILVLAGRPLQVVRTEAGERLVGQLSAEAALGGAALAADVAAVTYHVPGEWQLKRALAIQTFIDLLVERAAAGQRDAVDLLAGCAVTGLAALIDDALAPDAPAPSRKGAASRPPPAG